VSAAVIVETLCENHERLVRPLILTGRNIMPRLEQLLEMLKADPKDSFLRYGVGMEYVKAGRFADAIAEFDRLVENDPNYVAAYFMRGRAQESAGDVAAARSSYQRGIEVAKATGDHHAAEEIAGALEALDE
jgi:tetratricopeptide (TPR) repeat protein